MATEQEVIADEARFIDMPAVVDDAMDVVRPVSGTRSRSGSASPTKHGSVVMPIPCRTASICAWKSVVVNGAPVVRTSPSRVQSGTGWLSGLVDLDDHGFVLTGEAVEATSPYATSQPGIFAVGDVRSGSVKRVASSVGEGSVALSKVWEHVRA